MHLLTYSTGHVPGQIPTIAKLPYEDSSRSESTLSDLVRHVQMWNRWKARQCQEGKLN